MDIIPAIDIIDGKCVRLTQGDYQRKKEYSSDPLEVARQYEDHGIRRLHLVDLDGAKARKVVNYQVLEKITKHTGLQVDFGGGVQSDKDLQLVFELGAVQVTGGSIAVREPETFLGWIQKYGADKIILGADARERKIAIGGWQEDTATDVIDFIRDYSKKGVQYVICTDVGRDGLLQGPAHALYQDIIAHNPTIRLIASGGVSGVEDLQKLQEIKLDGVIVGKAIYENKISLKELEAFIN